MERENGNGRVAFRVTQIRQIGRELGEDVRGKAEKYSPRRNVVTSSLEAFNGIYRASF
jgi:hypothetical protein